MNPLMVLFLVVSIGNGVDMDRSVLAAVSVEGTETQDQIFSAEPVDRDVRFYYGEIEESYRDRPQSAVQSQVRYNLSQPFIRDRA